MSHGDIRRILRSCVSYHPGHRVHWIHAKRAHEPHPEITVVVLEIVVSRSSRISPVRDRSNGPLWLLPLLDMLRPSDVVAAAFAMPRRFGGSPSGVDRVASAALCLSL